jgi:hypothetical protein
MKESVNLKFISSIDLTAFDLTKLSIAEVIDRIETMNNGLAKFWTKATGWASIEAAGLLSKSRLDRQISLSVTFRYWDKPVGVELTDGELILAWTNLGSLVEGSLKLFLSVYFSTYKEDIDGQKKANAFDHKKQVTKSPDGLSIEPLRLYCLQRGIIDEEANKLVALIQDRRNAIHAFQDKPVGNRIELENAIKGYLQLLRQLNSRLPYPDEIYAPTELSKTTSMFEI